MQHIKERLIDIFGCEYVFDDKKTMEAYSCDMSFEDVMLPRFVVMAKNVEQINKVVALANETKTTLVPVSSGAPHYHGDTVPGVPGSIVIDMSLMKKILNISRQQRMAVIEPGVTYGELNEALKKEGLTISMPLAPRDTKSVLGSVVEVEPRLNAIHQWMYVEPLRCVGVTWGDGNYMFTGDAALGPMNLEAQWDSQKWQASASGPQALDFFRILTMAEGTMGIISWVSVKCEILPQIHQMYMIGAKKDSNLQNFMYEVLKIRFSDELFTVNAACLASLIGQTPGEISRLKNLLPPWITLVGIAGRELLPMERVEAQKHDIADIARKNGLEMKHKIAGISGEAVLDKVIKPAEGKYYKEKVTGTFQDIFFVTTLDRTTSFIDKVYDISANAGYDTKQIMVYIQPQHCGTSVHLEFSFPYDAENEAECTTTRTLYEEISKTMADMGAYYSRPYGYWAELQLKKDAQSYNTIRQMKEIFDPNNIMNTGKLTI